jgi:hypothetical protein
MPRKRRERVNTTRQIIVVFGNEVSTRKENKTFLLMLLTHHHHHNHRHGMGIYKCIAECVYLVLLEYIGRSLYVTHAPLIVWTRCVIFIMACVLLSSLLLLISNTKGASSHRYKSTHRNTILPRLDTVTRDDSSKTPTGLQPVASSSLRYL